MSRQESAIHFYIDIDNCYLKQTSNSYHNNPDLVILLRQYPHAKKYLLSGYQTPEEPISLEDPQLRVALPIEEGGIYFEGLIARASPLEDDYLSYGQSLLAYKQNQQLLINDIEFLENDSIKNGLLLYFLETTDFSEKIITAKSIAVSQKIQAQLEPMCQEILDYYSADFSRRKPYQAINKCNDLKKIITIIIQESYRCDPQIFYLAGIANALIALIEKKEVTLIQTLLARSSILIQNSADKIQTIMDAPFVSKKIEALSRKFSAISITDNQLLVNQLLNPKDVKRYSKKDLFLSGKGPVLLHILDQYPIDNNQLPTLVFFDDKPEVLAMIDILKDLADYKHLNIIGISVNQNNLFVHLKSFFSDWLIKNTKKSRVFKNTEIEAVLAILAASIKHYMNLFEDNNYKNYPELKKYDLNGEYYKALFNTYVKTQFSDKQKLNYKIVNAKIATFMLERFKHMNREDRFIHGFLGMPHYEKNQKFAFGVDLLGYVMGGFILKPLQSVARIIEYGLYLTEIKLTDSKIMKALRIGFRTLISPIASFGYAKGLKSAWRYPAMMASSLVAIAYLGALLFIAPPAGIMTIAPLIPTIAQSLAFSHILYTGVKAGSVLLRIGLQKAKTLFFKSKKIEMAYVAPIDDFKNSVGKVYAQHKTQAMKSILKKSAKNKIPHTRKQVSFIITTEQMSLKIASGHTIQCDAAYHAYAPLKNEDPKWLDNLEQVSLINNRHNHPQTQHEYDKRYGLVAKGSPTLFVAAQIAKYKPSDLVTGNSPPRELSSR